MKDLGHQILCLFIRRIGTSISENESDRDVHPKDVLSLTVFTESIYKIKIVDRVSSPSYCKQLTYLDGRNEYRLSEWRRRTRKYLPIYYLPPSFVLRYNYYILPFLSRIKKRSTDKVYDLFKTNPDQFLEIVY